MDIITVKLISKLRDHENEDCIMDGGCYTGELAGEAADKIESLEIIINERIDAEHYGTYGTACMNTGQLDAGECWICCIKRKKEQLRKCSIALVNAQANEGAWEATAQAHYEEAAKWKRIAGEHQLVAGRYQYLHEQAQKCIKDIDDFFEYQFRGHSLDTIQKGVQEILAEYTKTVSKLITKSRPSNKEQSHE